MRVTVAPLQISRSLPPVPIPVVATPMMVDRVVNIHHSQVFHTDSPLKQQSEQKLKLQLESRVQNLESQSPNKGKVEKLLEENEKLLQLVREKTEHASKYKGELLTAKKEITKQTYYLSSQTQESLRFEGGSINGYEIKKLEQKNFNWLNNISRASEKKAEQIMLEKQLLEQQYVREKQYMQNQINQLKEVIESQSSQNQSLQNIDYQQQHLSNPNQQIELFTQQLPSSGQIIKGSQKSIKKPQSTNQIQFEVPEYINVQSKNPQAQDLLRNFSQTFQDKDQQLVSPIKTDQGQDQLQEQTQQNIRKNQQRQQSYKQPDQVQRKSISPTYDQQQSDQLNPIRYTLMIQLLEMIYMFPF